MNRKFEDKLAELAFGDLSPEEASRLEKQAESNPEARRALSMYREMKIGLKGLADIPEDQFSKERLRDAILTQGLKPVAPRPVSPRAWLWMPCAALFIGFGFTVVKQNFMKQHVQPEILLGKADIKSAPLTADPSPIRVASNDSPSKPLGPVMPKSAPKETPDPNEESSDLFANDIRTDPGYSPDDGGSADPPATPASTTIKPAGAPLATGGATRVADNKPAPKSSTPSSGPIVLIDQAKDAQTGAEDATEVSSASNVLVGG